MKSQKTLYHRLEVISINRKSKASGEITPDQIRVGNIEITLYI